MNLNSLNKPISGALSARSFSELDWQRFIVTVDFAEACVSNPAALPRPVEGAQPEYRKYGDAALSPYTRCWVTGNTAEEARQRGLIFLQHAIADGTVAKVRRLRLQ